MKSQILIIAVFVAVGFLGYFVSQKTSSQTAINQQTTDGIGNPDCTPTFADGGGPYYKPNSPYREKIVPDVNNGESLVVTGRILKNDCKTALPGAVLDIWQANESGNYQGEWYRGRVTADENGNYRFEAVVPKGYGDGTGYRPPHIHFKVFLSGREIITSQMFFPEVKGRAGFDDAYIMKLTTENKDGIVSHSGTHNIILPID